MSKNSLLVKLIVNCQQ